MAPFPTKPPIDRDFGAKPQKPESTVRGRKDVYRSKGEKSIYSRSHFGKRNRNRTGRNLDKAVQKSNKEGHRKEMKTYRGQMRDWRQGKRENIRDQKADFRQERRDWIKSIFTG
jgi:hypothetical protein